MLENEGEVRGNHGYRCWAEIDLQALRENLAWLRHRVGPGVTILTVVKADAYGHGLRPIAALLMQSGTDIFGVANLVEARSIRSVGRGWPILMLGACLPEEVELAVRDDVMPTISTLAEAEQFAAAAARLRKTVAVHVKVDTGMGRLGVEPSEALALIKRMRTLERVQLQGLFTHYSSVEEDAEFSQGQAQAFRALVQQVRAAGIQIPHFHANNSGAVLWERDTLFNLVRPGLLVYGLAPGGKRPLDAWLQPQLRPALSFKCRVSLVKSILPGKPLSYGHAFVAPRAMRVATLTAGYGDGYLRSAGPRAQVLIQGRRCAILGRITMDQMLADVSEVPAARCGDEVVLIGRQQEDRITASELAAWMGTIPWEVFTCITARVPRLYLGGEAA